MTASIAAVPTIPGTGFEVPPEVLILGLITGLVYAIFGVGLVLVYRSSRVINFAHGEMGALAASLMPVFVALNGWSYWIALPVSLLVAAAAGAFTEFIAIRTLSKAPRLVVLVATIGISQVFFGLGTFIPKERLGAVSYPTPFDATVRVGTLNLTAGQLLILVMVPLVTLGLTLFIKKTKVGLASRASAENRSAARLVGIPVKRVSLVIWIVAGLTAGIAAILLGPTQPIFQREALGPDLLLRALTAAMLGGLVSIPATFAGGITVGILELLISWNYPTGGMLQVVLFALIMLAFLIRSDLGQKARGGERSSWSLAGAIREPDPRLMQHPRVKVVRRVIPVVLLAIAAIGPALASNAARVQITTLVLFALMGLSLTVLTGYAGQVSLGQFAFVALGAAVGGKMLASGYPHWVALLYAVVVGGAIAALVGLPALRIRGLFLAVATLGFAIAANAWMFNQDWLVRGPDGQSALELPRPSWLESELAYYYGVLVLTVLVAVSVARLRRTGIGRAMMAVRDNEASAATLSIPPRRIKLIAFVLSGMIASLAGFLYGGLLVNFTRPQEIFPPELSLVLLGMVIVGGVTTVTGAIAGAIFLRGLGVVLAPLFPQLFGSSVALMISGLGLLGAAIQLPGGIAGKIFDRMQLRYRQLAGLAEDELTLDTSGRAQGLPRPHLPPRTDGSLERPAAADETEHEAIKPVLEARDVLVRFGGNTAVDGVSLHAQQGEIVGLVGPNGAGKTTLFDVLSGQLRPTSGTVLLHGDDITDLRPERRALQGLGRTFQQAELFGELRVKDVFKVALERREPSETVPSLLALPPSVHAERRKDIQADELIELLGLEPFAHLHTSELSTGMRRIVELGTVVALGADVLLLDEPTAGIAQREVEAFRPVLREVRDHLGATVVVIEHDIPMIMDLADRLYVLAAGEVIAEGPPELLRTDERVIAAYLGTDERVIHRSGELAAT